MRRVASAAARAPVIAERPRRPACAREVLRDRGTNHAAPLGRAGNHRRHSLFMPRAPRRILRRVHRGRMMKRNCATRCWRLILG